MKTYSTTAQAVIEASEKMEWTTFDLEAYIGFAYKCESAEMFEANIIAFEKELGHAIEPMREDVAEFAKLVWASKPQPETVLEYRVDGMLNGKWEECGYRATRKEAEDYKRGLETGLARNCFLKFRIETERVRFEKSEQYLKLQQK